LSDIFSPVGFVAAQSPTVIRRTSCAPEWTSGRPLMVYLAGSELSCDGTTSTVCPLMTSQRRSACERQPFAGRSVAAGLTSARRTSSRAQTDQQDGSTQRTELCHERPSPHRHLQPLRHRA
jgi:hypothetical protein